MFSETCLVFRKGEAMKWNARDHLTKATANFETQEDDPNAEVLAEVAKAFGYNTSESYVFDQFLEEADLVVVVDKGIPLKLALVRRNPPSSVAVIPSSGTPPKKRSNI